MAWTFPLAFGKFRSWNALGCRRLWFEMPDRSHLCSGKCLAWETSGGVSRKLQCFTSAKFPAFPKQCLRTRHTWGPWTPFYLEAWPVVSWKRWPYSLLWLLEWPKPGVSGRAVYYRDPEWRRCRSAPYHEAVCKWPYTWTLLRKSTFDSFFCIQILWMLKWFLLHIIEKLA